MLADNRYSSIGQRRFKEARDALIVVLVERWDRLSHFEDAECQCVRSTPVLLKAGALSVVVLMVLG